MMNLTAFCDKIDTIQRLNHVSEDDAGRYAVLVGDTPEPDGNGKVIVRENGIEIARIVLAE